MSGTASMARERQRPVTMTEAPFTIDTPTGPIAGFTSTETGPELLLFGLAPSTANEPFTVAQHVADAIAVLDSLRRRRTGYHLAGTPAGEPGVVVDCAQ